MIKISYWNEYDILDIHYEGSYRNWFWLNVDVLTPEYPIFREQIENGLGETQTTFMRWGKQYSFDVYCTEQMVDFLSTITLHTDVWIEFDNGYSGKATDFNAVPEWTKVQSIAKVTCTFTVKSYTINGASAAHC